MVIPGGSGQVGQVLASHFHGAGQAVTILSRCPGSVPWRTILWDARELGNWRRELDGADLVINLAGRNVNCRYSERNRREILESLVCATEVLGRSIAEAVTPAGHLDNTSTATIYRHAFARPKDEATGELSGCEPDAPMGGGSISR